MRVEVSVAMEKGGVWSGKEVDWDASARMDYSAMNCRSTRERRREGSEEVRMRGKQSRIA